MVKATEQLELHVPDLKKAAMVFRAMNNPLRREILQLLHQKQKIKVGEIYKKMKLSQSTASQQLGILRRAGIVTTQREGKQVFYSVNYTRVDFVHKLADELLHTKQKA